MRYSSGMRLLFSLALVAAVSRCASAPPVVEPVVPAEEAFAGVRRVTRDVPKMVARREPYVPQELQRVDTDVTIDVLVRRDGSVVGSRYVSGDRRFFDAVATATQQWRFEPLAEGGEAVAFVLPVRFTLTWPAPARADIRIRYVTD
ncbi:MAG TPA: energy transducer TonB [Thermoanaerobaculia bacterium]|jgi:TonB family protein|nr:energy transducer TonB [Thermoanaerobaculia bacterium]